MTGVADESMPTVSPQQVSPGQEITAASVNTPNNQLAEVINGGLDDTNIAGLSGSKIQAGTIPNSALDENANIVQRFNESFNPFVASGLTWSQVSGLNGAMTDGVAYINGVRLEVNAITSRTFDASRDTYVTLSPTGIVEYQPVNNNAAAPTFGADHLPVAVVVTNATDITGVHVISTRRGTQIGRMLLGAASDEIVVSNLPVRGFFRLYISIITSGDTDIRLTFNEDTSASYRRRVSANGASDTTDGSNQTSLNISSNSMTSGNKFCVLDIDNTTGSRKRVNGIISDSSAPPNRMEISGIWTQTSSPITSIRLHNGESGGYGAGSEMLVLDI